LPLLKTRRNPMTTDAPVSAELAGPAEPSVEDVSDVVEDLGDQIAILAAHVHAATHRLLTLIAKFDRLQGWERAGFRSCAHWLAFRTGFDLGAAREKVRAARALEALPETSAAMARGELSFAKVRALTRVASPENESELLDLARSGTAAELERVVRSWKRFGRADEAEQERRRHATRCISIFPDEDGMYLVRGRLDPEVGALLMRAIEAAGDALFHGNACRASPEQRRADAVGLLAERAMAAGFGASGPEDVPVSGTGAQRYQVVLNVESATLESGGEPGRADLADGTRVSAETCRRLACDASVVRVAHDSNGAVLDVGRKTRTIPPALRRALEARDRGCRFPGCGLLFTDGHHIRHWADGGETSLENTILLCKHHHRLLHEEGFRVELNAWPGGRPTFYDRRGLPVPDAAPGPCLPLSPVDALIRHNEQTGTEPNYATCSARAKFDDAITSGCYDRALRALTQSA
jgi:hypothetical protein